MRALICGAGIAGLALAGRLDEHGWDVTVVERAPGPRAQGYMIDFSGPGVEAITAMGLLPQLRAKAAAVDTFQYVDGQGRANVTVNYDRFVTALDGELVSIMRPALEELLRAALSDRVQLRYGTTVDQVADESVRLSDGSVQAADLVVGADGIHSHIRSLAFGGEQQYLRYLDMHTSAFVFRDDELLDRVRGRFALTETRHRQMGFYGIGGGQVAAFSVHRTSEPALPSDPRAELRRQYAGMGELVERALARCPEDVYYDQVAQVVMPRWSSRRVVLLGDAAYAVSLVAGQGASLGIAGAYVLAEMLASAPSVEAGIAEYERRWRPVATGIQDKARGRVATWFLPTSAVTLLLRRWGFRAMSIPGLSKLLVGSLFPKDHRTVVELAAAMR